MLTFSVSVFQLAADLTHKSLLLEHPERFSSLSQEILIWIKPSQVLDYST